MNRLLVLISFFVSFQLYGQVTFQPKQPDNNESKGVIYEQEQTIHFKFHTRGFALGYDIGKIEQYNLTNYYTLQFGYIRHPKEYRQSFGSTSSNIVSRPIVYGKQNNLLALRGLYKQKKYLSEKAKKKGIAIGYTYSFGVVAGILKPYYISVTDNDSPTSTGSRSIKYSEENEDLFLDANMITGADGFFKGFGEMKIVPGLTADASIVFSLGAYESFARSIEAGMMIDVFPQVMPIMVNAKNSPYFINVYFNIFFGRRW